jgi:uncharacterized surface protein with fasciclin (FAS1) repeats
MSCKVGAIGLSVLVMALGAGGCQSTKQSDSMSGMRSDDKMMRGDIIDVATGAGMSRVTTLVQAVQAAELVQTLKGPGPFTVFAPTNEAFAKLPAGTLEMLLKPENKEKLKGILLYHVHVGEAIPAAKVRTMSLSTANGKPLMVSVHGGNVMINNARVIKTDVMASNGIIHWIDAVVLP